MNNRIKLASVAIVGLLVVGCNKSNDNTPASNAAAGASNAASSVGSSASSALDTMKQKAGDLGSSASNAASDIKDKTSNALGEAKDKASNAMSGMTGGSSATTLPSSGDSSALATAKTKLQQVQDYISSGKLDQADTALKDLEANKSSLPDSMQTQITSLRTKLDSLKNATGGVNLPSLPGSH